ncbi:MAG TPA: hypothetical protein PK675_01695 [Clostridia bacterium]|nr:hypothetical protein [Clostridia bacterium]
MTREVTEQTENFRRPSGNKKIFRDRHLKDIVKCVIYTQTDKLHGGKMRHRKMLKFISQLDTHGSVVHYPEK